ncbi:2-amino-4-hydroxy-6-hydroxymethyldihydropteridine diphosphokinase [Micromonospora lutea]|uniref:2-amino-4-hydroxy-6-hydroxymethyldihydropteridine diphosphokinase n=1 Tax=Micromonospora lutea TaxID=419825 RepID=A0ABQ4IV95_9ACTN|nr:2-amino-4-hydroxy-6-hydroxymethyldihydropteridine diphosphokinase [Micromonospora lutea]GIJ21837.1 2-amino-4-hydroxy-6-hydroxymethyldihydropteridine pyrophosphokinase [Micromonospora lutea]
MTRAVLSLGSNLGDRLGHLRTALATLGDSVLVVSGVYETPPWGDTEQPAYLNAVLLAADPTAGPYDWLARCRAAENAAGRIRDPGRRFGPRTLDVDVVAVWTDDDRPVFSQDPELTLPHPRAHLRAFVLRPWIDIQPYGQLPGHGWLTDLLTTGSAAAEVPELSPRPDLTLESTA